MEFLSWKRGRLACTIGGEVRYFLSSVMLWSVVAWSQPAWASEWFADVTAAVGINFLHQDGRSGLKYYVETAASGGGWLDFDNDGDLDIYLINGGLTPGSPLTTAPSNALYENRNGTFVDITEHAGVGKSGYGMGMCVGDIDADGLLDFLVTNYRGDHLYRNLGQGRFQEIGQQAGVVGMSWSTGCAFGDLDGDGDLDLYVAHYVDFTFTKNPFCGDRARNLRAYCRPDVFAGQPDSLFINQGDGTFRDEAEQRGIARGRDEKGFGVVLSDIDNDNDLDIYVANDGTMNRLYVNDGKGVFVDHALTAGVGLNRAGVAESGMGVDIGDVNRDGWQDIIVTNYSMETNTLYQNRGQLLFDDVTQSVGIAEPSYKQVGWGVAFLDYDNDSDLDLGVVNGHAIDNIELFEASLSYRQPKQLFANDGTGRFREVTAQVGGTFATPRVGRGLAVGDWNSDGRLDLLVTNTNDRPELLENRLRESHHWLGLRLRGSRVNPFAIGARVTLTAGGLTLLREVRSGGSFLSQGDLRVHFGLGTQTGPVQVEVRWPDGTMYRRTITELDRYWDIAYGGEEKSKGKNGEKD